MLDNRIKFDERYDDTESELTTLYFIASKEMLAELGFDYPDAVSMEISLEFPLGTLVAERADACISPTDEDGTDYDWNDVDLPYNDVVELILLAEKEEVKTA